MALAVAPAALSNAPQVEVTHHRANAIIDADRGAVDLVIRGVAPTRDFRATARPLDQFIETSVPGWETLGRGSLVHTFHGYRNVTSAYFRAAAVDGSTVRLTIASGDHVACDVHSGASGEAVCNVILGDTAPEMDTYAVRASTVPASGSLINVEGGEGMVSTSGPTELMSRPVVGIDGKAVVRYPIVMSRYRPGWRVASVVEHRDGDGPVLGHFLLTTSRRDGEFIPRPLLASWDGDDVSGEYYAYSSMAGISEHRGLTFAIPGNAERVSVELGSLVATPGSGRAELPAGTLIDLELELFHLGHDDTASRVVPVPATREPTLRIDRRAASADNRDVREMVTLDGPDLRPGRWHAAFRNKTGTRINASINVTYVAARGTLLPRFGHYFNPSRPGHGFILAPAGPTWVLIWYHYDEHGHPTWYYAQASEPRATTGGSLWDAALYRVVWNGEKTRFQMAGHVNLSAIDQQNLEFSYSIAGDAGIETMQRLGGGGCPLSMFDTPVDLNGLWYAPTKSGYGFSTELVGGAEFLLAYAFDDGGLPRWLTGQQAIGTNHQFPLLQAAGFCPTCPVTPVQRAAVGSVERSIVATADPDGQPGYGLLGIDARFADGVSGAWRESRAAALLSNRFGCR